MSKISVIIPIYNGEKFLADTIDSILSQQFEDFELLLVNDGSKDSSAEICEHYSRIDPRVRFIDQKNSGASLARLNGIKHAYSNWITFVDQDDLLEEFALGTFFSAISDNVGLIVSDCEVQIKDATQYIKSILTSTIPVTNWGKLFRKEVLKDFLFKDARNIRLGDDVIINFRLGMLSPDLNIKSIPNRLYKYNLGININSMTTSFKRTEEYEQQFYSTLTNGFSEEELKPFLNELIQIRLNALSFIIIDNNYTIDKNSIFFRELIKDINRCNYPLTRSNKLMLNSVTQYKYYVFAHRIKGYFKRKFLK